MISTSAFKIPAASLRVEQEIKRSKFIISIEQVDSRSEAKTFVNKIKKEFPDANHNCWAYLVGNPASTSDLGQSDDGEPQGTAGKPMLNVLQHKDIGNIAVVVTRYFGGIKLGTGGLVRAYSSSVQYGIDQLSLKLYEPLETLMFQIPFPFENSVRSILSQQDIEISNASYSDSVTLQISISASQVEEVKEKLENLTSGDILFYDSVG